MELGDAIIHAEEVADRCAVTDGNIKCEIEHRQLAEWLRELKERREQDVPDTNVGDMISRQAAIDEIRKCRFVVDAIEKIIGLPSAQPEPCEDTVSRRRLLNDLKELIAAWKKYPVMAEQIKGVEATIGYVETIPSVTPKRKTGEMSRSIDGSAIIMWLNDWWASSFGQKETPESKAIREVLDKVVEYIESERK